MRKYIYLLLPAAFLGILLFFSGCEQMYVWNPNRQVEVRRDVTVGDDNYARLDPDTRECYFYHPVIRKIWGVRCLKSASECNCTMNKVNTPTESSALANMELAITNHTVSQYFSQGNWQSLFPGLADSLYLNWRQGLANGTYQLVRIDGDSLSNDGNKVKVFEVDDPAVDSLQFVLLTEIE